MSSLSYRRSLWIHQYDQLGETTIAAICQTATQIAGASVVLKKLYDGSSIMGPGIDTSPLAPATLAAFQAQQAEAAAAGVTMLPWINVTSAADADLHAAAGPTLVLDLEPYAGFWQGTPAQLAGYLGALRAGGVTEIVACIDLRQSAVDAIGLSQWVGLVDALALECYWTDFQQPASVIPPLLPPLTAYGKELIPVLPFDGAAVDMGAVWAAARVSGCTGVSLWKMGDANLTQLQAFGALTLPVAPQPKPMLDTAARLQLVGYVAGGSSVSDLVTWLGGYQ